MKTIARTPHLVDGSRSVHPTGRFPTASLVLVGVLPLLPLLLAVVDDRAGFRILMLSLVVATATLAIALVVWVLSLRERRVRIAATGPLRLAPDPRVGVVLWLVPLAGMLPALAAAVAQTQEWETLGGRLLEWGPYVLGAVSLGGLVREIVALRKPLGLVIDPHGLRGVRGSGALDISWDEVGDVAPVGPHGPKLSIAIAGRAPAIIDAHRLGTDPAAAAAVIAFFRDHPGDRHALADGVAAMQAITAAP